MGARVPSRSGRCELTGVEVTLFSVKWRVVGDGHGFAPFLYRTRVLAAGFECGRQLILRDLRVWACRRAVHDDDRLEVSACVAHRAELSGTVRRHPARAVFAFSETHMAVSIPSSSHIQSSYGNCFLSRLFIDPRYYIINFLFAQSGVWIVLSSRYYIMIKNSS